MQSPLITIRGLTKTFPGVRALDGVDLDVAAGEVHCLAGENGAGKSTLIKIIAGIYSRDAGTIELAGEPIEFHSPAEAIRSGIRVLHQELSLVRDMTVAENILLGQEPRRARLPLIDKRALHQAAARILAKIGVELDPATPVARLSTAQQQMVELARAVSRQARCVILDEPSSALSDREVQSLFGTVRGLKEQGVAIIYISHRLEEIQEIGDRVTVLKDGRIVTTLSAAEAPPERLVPLMVGREIASFFPQEHASPGDDALTVRGLTRRPAFRDVSFSLRRGEILGIAGLVGAGRTELLRGLFGADAIDAGTVTLYGEPVRFHSPAEAIACGIGLVPEDRRGQGVLLEKPVSENISLASLGARSPGGFVDRRWERTTAADYVQKLGIRTPSVATSAGKLSGGNQQKVVLARWFAVEARILLLDEPTRGIDVAAKREIYSLIRDFVSRGGSVIMVSSDLPELLGVADRLMVMRKGTVRGMLDIGEASEERVMGLASLD